MLQGLGLFAFIVGGCFVLSGASIPGFGLCYLGAKGMMAGD